MLGYFPDPFPDELLYSICARCQERAWYGIGRKAIQAFFGTSQIVATVGLSNRLNHLISVLPPGHKYS